LFEIVVKEPKKLELHECESSKIPVGDEVKVKLTYGGICGSDISVFKGNLPHAKYPVRAGHELVGVIIEKGPDSRFEIGARCVILPNTFCGNCDRCKKGLTNICRHKQSLGINVDGGFVQELVISSKYILEIPDELSFEKAVLIEPLAVVVHAFSKVNIKQDTEVAITGCGNEGLLAAALAQYLGAKVTAIDINPAKFELVKRLGKIRACLPEEVIGRKTFHIVIEAAGTKYSAENAIQLTESGGDIVLIGLVNEASLPIVQMVRNELTMKGSIIYQFPNDYQRAIDYLLDPNFPSESVISNIYPITDYQIAYEMAALGNSGKILLNFQEEKYE